MARTPVCWNEQGPPGLSCWDLDGDNQCDLANPDEDVNNDGVCTIVDCGVDVRSAVAIGTTDVAVPTTESDADDMTVSLTTIGTRLLVTFTAIFENDTSSGKLMTLKIQVDGVTKATFIPDVLATGEGFSQSFQWLDTGLVPGSHMVKLRWSAVDPNDVFQNGASDGPRVLTVVDLP